MKGTKPHLRTDKNALDKVPSAPSWMSKDSRAEWRRVMPALVQRRILTEADMGSVENYCIAIGTAREAARHIEEHGQVFEARKVGADGEPVSLGFKRNPSVAIQAEAINRSRLLAAELGLTPVSRSRPAIRDDGDADSLLD